MTFTLNGDSWLDRGQSGQFIDGRKERRYRPLEGLMSDVTLNLLVLKTQQLDRLKEFYSALGLSFAEEKHGDVPLHLAARVGEVVLELYPLPADAGPADA